MFKTGDPVVFHKEKKSMKPSLKAWGVRPHSGGDGYSYFITKYWRVITADDSKVVVATRGGKQLEVNADDPKLRKANIFERVFKKHIYSEIPV
ncbi:MAG: hypothetical protein HQL32_12905 [Planctomycetes bacterium]|nr:hypothetical protein [Planctomycetota bacterium]